MTHKGKVVVDQQGRVMGKDGKLLKDKKGNFVYLKADKKGNKNPAADSGETHRKNAKVNKKKDNTPTTRIPFNKKNAAAAPSGDTGGAWSASEMDAWKSHLGKSQ